MLHEEKIVGEVNNERISGKKLALERKLHLLLSDIEIAIHSNHNAILIFAKVCMHTNNENLGNSILRDCCKLLLIIVVKFINNFL